MRGLALAALGTLAGLLLVELGVRVATHEPLLTWGGHESDAYVIVDPSVGRVPKPGLSVRLPKGIVISTGDYGTRRTSATPPPAERPVTLVVGDSFAFGDDVNDDEAWPAVLQRRLSRPVINAAVPGFGLDQAVLRAEQLARVYSPEIIVVGFIPHDVMRCEMSYWSGHPKPYFDIDQGGLRFHAAPVPPRPAYALLKQILSASAALDLAIPQFIHWEGPEALVVHHRGREVACQLMARLDALAQERRAHVLVVAQPQSPDSHPDDHDLKNGVLACARQSGLSTLDLLPVIDPLPTEQRQRLFHGHMTAEGNRLVATHVADVLAPIVASPAPDVR